MKPTNRSHSRTEYLLAVLVTIGLVGVLAPLFERVGAQEPVFRISEFMAANPGPPVDDDGNSSDWIEIQNTSAQAASLGGWSLHDSSNSWTMPDVRLAPGDYLVVWASGEDRSDPAADLHTNFKLTAGGEYLALQDQAGVVATQFAPSYPKQLSGVSYGFDATGEAGFMAIVTPGFTNSSLANPVASAPVAQFGSSFQSVAFTERLTTDTPNGSIRYTLDGTAPTSESVVAPGGEVNVNPSAGITTLRAATFADGYQASSVVTITYVNADAAASSVGGGSDAAAGIRSLSVVSVSTESQADPASAETYEPARIDYVDLHGDGFSEPMGMKPSGYSSFRSSPKKTFRVNFSSAYGTSELNYPLFSDQANEYFEPSTRFDQLELRGYSLDGYFGGPPGLYLSNEFARSITLDLGTLSSHGRAVNLFIDGTYRGVYQLRERINADWMSEYLGGDGDDYESWFIDDVLRTADLNDGSGEVFAAIDAAPDYQSIKHLIDARSLINSSIALWFYSGYTEKEWRVLGPSDPDHPGGMHFIPNDLDLALSSRYDPGRSESMRDYLNRFDDDAEFEQILWDQAALAFCNGGEMTVGKMLARFDGLVDEIRAVMPAEVAAFNWGSMASWNQSIALARERVVTGHATTESEWTAKGWLNGCNRAPQIEGPLAALAVVGQPVEFAVDAADPEGNAVSFSSSGLPPGLSIAPATGVISGTPSQAGSFTSFVRASDSNSRWLESAVTWHVLEAALEASPIQLNELNYVDNSGAWAGNDPVFPDSADNGGDWFELLVVEADTDLRGWTIDLWDRDRTTGRYKQTEAFTFADDDRLASLPAGLLITISEDLAEDAVFDLGDDWHINVSASGELAGELLKPEGRSNFDTSADGLQLIARSPDGAAAGKMVGLSRSWAAHQGGLGPAELLVTCGVAAIANPVTDYVAEAATSTFGQPNQCGGIDQDLNELRDVVYAGDTNCDGTTSGADVESVLELGVGLRTATSGCPLAEPDTTLDTRRADMNGDGLVNLLDALMIARCLGQAEPCG